MRNKLVLCILDGCGVREETDGNAFKNANTPTLDMLFEKYPNSILEASGPAVGLPEGQMGTSEVGHMNLGSGRMILFFGLAFLIVKNYVVVFVRLVVASLFFNGHLYSHLLNHEKSSIQ